MPLYRFYCPVCGQRFEELLTIAQKDNAVCPSCGKKAERFWMGKCAFGAKKSSSDERVCDCAAQTGGGCSGGCSGSCAGCAGCGR